MVWPDQSKYEGEWKDDARDGKGTFYYVNGDKYVGDWKDDVQHGKGIYYFNSGDRYEGDYVNGERTGQGILCTQEWRQVCRAVQERRAAWDWNLYMGQRCCV